MRATRRVFLQASAAAGVLPAVQDPAPSSGAAQDPPLAEAEPLTGSRDVDGGGRMTVPVRINGLGDFAFVVDCAAEASVISRDLATRLGLTPTGRLTMHSLAGSEQVDTVRAASLTSGALRRHDARLILGLPSALGDVDGLLGADLLEGHRLIFRFGLRPSITVEVSRAAWIWPFSGRQRIRFETSTTRARGGLLTFSVQVGAVQTTVILDSGAAISVINPALAQAAGAVALAPSVLLHDHLISPTGLEIAVQPFLLSGLRFGGLQMRNQPVLAANLHTFGVLGLAEQPAMLMGMDVLGQFREVVIDMRRGELVLQR
ncbi:MAG: hypothetical protein EON90_03560 [Brevundimonas sp.]|nr:MAG: hypothetical protein EON90_03560 [Brevundimonas sp.]